MENVPCITIQTSNTCTRSGSRAGVIERYMAWRVCPASQYRLLTHVQGVDAGLEIQRDTWHGECALHHNTDF